MNMPFRATQLLWLLFLGYLILPSPASADSTIYSNLNSNPADSYQSGLFGVSNTLVSGFFQSAAASFTSSGNFEVTQLELAVQFFNNGTPDCPQCATNTQPFNLSLVTSTAGQPGSTVLFSQQAISSEPTTFSPGGICCSLLTLNVNSGVFLNAGQTYWLVAAPTNGATTVLWQFNNLGAAQPWSLNYGFVDVCPTPGTCATVPDPSGWTSQSGANPAFAIFGETIATPEPSSLALVTAAVLLAALLKLTLAKSISRA
jgi:hypothetical protein